MTKEEAKEIIKEVRFDINTKINGTTRFSQALEVAIEALEEEPFMNKPCVACVAHQVLDSGTGRIKVGDGTTPYTSLPYFLNPDKCHEDKVKVLDKIADEVNKLDKVGYEGKVYVSINAIFSIIDKYKEESVEETNI